VLPRRQLKRRGPFSTSLDTYSLASLMRAYISLRRHLLRRPPSGRDCAVTSRLVFALRTCVRFPSGQIVHPTSDSCFETKIESRVERRGGARRIILAFVALGRRKTARTDVPHRERSISGCSPVAGIQHQRPYYTNPSSNALACFKSNVSKPSVNEP
jgi:hypothetical protein